VNNVSPDNSASLAMDVKSLAQLRLDAKQNAPKALQDTARQFEALFLNMMIKSMRQASPTSETSSGQDTQMYTAMLDQQLSQTMAKRGIGLAGYLLRQMTPAQTSTPVPAPLATSLPPAPAPAPVQPVAAVAQSGKTSPAQQFQSQMSAHAQEAAQLTGLPASFILGQAALESGWGRRQIAAADGSPSHNLFGLKAGASWHGKVAETTTTEYVNGVPKKVVQRFRAYDNYADAFRDYAALLRRSPRYEQVIAMGQTLTGFSEGLQKAGYATDPHYADKLSRVIQQVRVV
jgi:flagellar protein FlgJ